MRLLLLLILIFTPAAAFAELGAPTGNLLDDSRWGNNSRAGTAMDIDQKLLAVGIPGESRVDVYQAEADAWSYLTSVEGKSSSRFGVSLDLEGDLLAVGAPLDNRGGTVTLFARQDDDTFVQIDQRRGDRIAIFANFGQGVSLNEGRLVVTEPGSDPARLHLFAADSTGLTDLDAKPLDVVGPVVIDGYRVAVTVEGSEQLGDSDEVHLFTITTDRLRAETEIREDDAAEDDGYGHAIALRGDALAVGAPGRSSDRGEGAVFLYGLSNANVHGAREIGPTRAKIDAFGSALTLTAELFVVGASDAQNQGAAMAVVFERSGGELGRGLVLEPLEKGEAAPPATATTAGAGKVLVAAPTRLVGPCISSYTMRENQAPSAEDLSVQVAHGESVEIDLSGVDPDGDPLAISIVSSPSSGRLTLEDDVATYVSLDGANDEFIYQVEDPFGGLDEATVEIRIRHAEDEEVDPVSGPRPDPNPVAPPSSGADAPPAEPGLNDSQTSCSAASGGVSLISLLLLGLFGLRRFGRVLSAIAVVSVFFVTPLAHAQDPELRTNTLAYGDWMSGSRAGQSIDIEAELLAVGVPGADRVDVFEHDGELWTHISTLFGPEDSAFGTSVDLGSDLLAVGAPHIEGSGTLFVYERGPADQWVDLAELDLGNLFQIDHFEARIDAEGNRLAFSYRSTESSHIEVHELGDEGLLELGRVEIAAGPVAISGEIVVATETVDDARMIRIFSLEIGGLEPRATITDAELGTDLGTSLELDGSTLVVASEDYRPEPDGRIGHVFVQTLEDGVPVGDAVAIDPGFNTLFFGDQVVANDSKIFVMSFARRPAGAKPVVHEFDRHDLGAEPVLYETPQTFSESLLIAGLAANNQGVAVGLTDTLVGPRVFTVEAERNGMPLAREIYVRAPMGSPIEVDVSTSDPDGDPLAYEIIDGPSFGGSVSLEGALATFETDANANETFTVQATDPFGGFAWITVGVAVHNPADSIDSGEEEEEETSELGTIDPSMEVDDIDGARTPDSGCGCSSSSATDAGVVPLLLIFLGLIRLRR